MIYQIFNDMKIKEYNRETSFDIGAGRPIINFNKAGNIGISMSLINLLSLSNGDGIKFHQDEDRPIDWYLEKSDERNAFSIRIHKTKRATTAIFCCKAIISTIAASIGIGHGINFSCLVSGETIEVSGKKLYPIITKSAKTATKRQL